LFFFYSIFLAFSVEIHFARFANNLAVGGFAKPLSDEGENQAWPRHSVSRLEKKVQLIGVLRFTKLSCFLKIIYLFYEMIILKSKVEWKKEKIIVIKFFKAFQKGFIKTFKEKLRFLPVMWAILNNFEAL
jgi:hypothetical protein